MVYLTDNEVMRLCEALKLLSRTALDIEADIVTNHAITEHAVESFGRLSGIAETLGCGLEAIDLHPDAVHSG